MGHNEPLALVTKAPNEPVAVMWQGILENEGIPSVIKPQDLKAAMYVPSLIAACDIYVLAAQSGRAREILEPFIREQPDASPDNPPVTE
jgi:hypothetical protein